MKTSVILSALLGLLPAALVSSEQTSEVTLDPNFRPPQVFKNANLVHVISLEKNYAKEQLNILIENISGDTQDEYYVPFTADQISRLGGFEVKDRKDSENGSFAAEVVEYDPNSDIQYYRIRLPTPLKPGAQQTLGITYYYLSAYLPRPPTIEQTESQYLAYDFSVYAQSAYVTTKQKTDIKAGTGTIPNYTKIPASGSTTESPQKSGSKLTYGPFDEKPAGSTLSAQVRFEFNRAVNHVSELERDMWVSHWGGNVAFEENYVLFNRGANLTRHFDRVQWAQSQYYNPTSWALTELRVPLQVGSVDPYFTDVIGNVSTSRFRSNKREANLELKPRYPLFGGWKYPFTIGWNSDTANFVRKTATGGYVFRAPFIEGPRQAEGIEYENIKIRIILPEGAENVKISTDVPEASLTDTSIDLHKTYLDTVGRTAVTIKAKNLVDEFRDRHIIVAYDLNSLTVLRKPLVIFATMLGLYVSAWLLSKIEVGFAQK